MAKSTKQKTVYLDNNSQSDIELINYIGSGSFSPTILKLAKIGMELDKLGISSLMDGLRAAGYKDDELLLNALKLISKTPIDSPQEQMETQPQPDIKTKRPMFAKKG